MNPSQQELRRAAAKAFMESLDQLGTSLTSAEEPLEPTSATQKTTAETEAIANSKTISVEALEEAVADIEQFIQEIQQQPE